MEGWLHCWCLAWAAVGVQFTYSNRDSSHLDAACGPIFRPFAASGKPDAWSLPCDAIPLFPTW